MLLIKRIPFHIANFFDILIDIDLVVVTLATYYFSFLLVVLVE